MEYRTGYFAKSKLYKELGYFPVSIARFNPKGTNFMQWLSVAPNKQLLQDYKSGNIDESQYESLYMNQLNNCDIKNEWNYLHNTIAKLRVKYKGIVFICYEKSGAFCHRHIFAKYISELLGIDFKGELLL